MSQCHGIAFAPFVQICSTLVLPRLLVCWRADFRAIFCLLNYNQLGLPSLICGFITLGPACNQMNVNNSCPRMTRLQETKIITLMIHGNVVSLKMESIELMKGPKATGSGTLFTTAGSGGGFCLTTCSYNRAVCESARVVLPRAYHWSLGCCMVLRWCWKMSL